ncbi:MAG: SDR family oxidoreductase [Legionella sp.]|nr:SDR family oxidoreductase [Legionella sp.]
MDLQLRDKTALVTGSTAGIGLAIAELLAREGATVAINGRTEERVTQAIQTIQTKVPEAKLFALVGDVSNSNKINTILNELPTVDILINNVGIYDTKPFCDITDDEWQQVFDVNVMSGIRLSRHYLRSMLEQNWGRIIFISSESGIQIPTEMIHYGMTKTAQIAIARGIAESVSGTNVTVNSVLPGPTRSEGVETFIQHLSTERKQDVGEFEKEFFKTMRASSLLQRFITPEEIASMVVFLSSPLAAATNGAAIRVEGGIVRSII